MSGGYLYMVAFEGGLVKFGWSGAPSVRWRALNADGMRIVASAHTDRIEYAHIKAEMALLESARVRFGAPVCGREWFLCNQPAESEKLLRQVYSEFVAKHTPSRPPQRMRNLYSSISLPCVAGSASTTAAINGAFEETQ
jgi:hypothetical protein